MESIRRFFPAPRGSFFLFGPRGTGKSTWLRSSFPQALFVDLLDPETFRACLSRPERLAELALGRSEAPQIVVDEVQKVPALLDVVHQLIEGPARGRQFILTGSSSRKLRRAGVDLLAGRLALQTMHPFMAGELGPRFDLGRSLRTGLLPVVLGAPDPDAALAAYVTLYLKEEVQAEGLVRNLGQFSRFLEAISFSHGSLLSLSAVARECEVERKTVEGFVGVLEDLLLGFRLAPFTRRARRQLVHHSKFYFADAGVFRAVRPRGVLDSPEEIGGASLEGLVAQHLRAWIAYRGGERRLHFWRTKSGVEVDFVLYHPEAFVALEVKASRRVSTADLRALRAFREDYPQAQACLLYGGKDRLSLDGIPCLPCEDFLRALVPGEDLAGLCR